MGKNRDLNLDRLNSLELKLYSKEYLVYFFLFKELRSAITRFAKGKLLDIGCGNKPYEIMLKPYINEHLGCDIVQSSNNKVDVICEATMIPIKDAAFDTIISTQTIEHIGDFQTMVNEAYRLLKPGGHFIVSGPMYWPIHEEPYDFHRFTKYGFIHSLEKAGFIAVEVNANGGKWAFLGQAIIHTLPDLLTFPKIIKIVHNWFFKTIDRWFYDPSNTLNYVAIGRK
ncbi:MAG: class I SAM-dependent methyltransferase [bacterium]|nr:class I SAM-dependent methyltransferase [bacterium]